jgi:hypothetical protein
VERRTFLVLGAAAVGLAGCTQDAPPPDVPTTTRPARKDPDEALRTQVARAEAGLIVAYRQAISRQPDLEPELAVILTHHEAHLARVEPDEDAAAELVRGSAAASGASPEASAAGPTASPEASAAGPTASPEASGAGSKATPQASSSDLGQSLESAAAGQPAAPEPPTPSSASPSTTGQVEEATDVLARLGAAEAEALEERTSACDAARSAVLARDLCLIAASEAQHESLLGSLRERASP